MSETSDTPWEASCAFAAQDFAERCASLRDSNPYETSALEYIVVYLASEFWDRNFSQTEIRNAFAEASAQMTRYCAGEERRGDKR
jgi:hypothetical protein